MSIQIIVLAHNEERRIATCLASLPLGQPGVVVHVIVNGTHDATASIARAAGAVVHEYAQGGKARSWNRFVLDELADYADVCAFVDGDAEVASGSIEALAKALKENPDANAAAGLPLNGRSVASYRREMQRLHGMFGDLYALRGTFLGRMKAAGIRLPEDLIGDDSLIGALAKTDLGHEIGWVNDRIISCPDSGFYCESATLWNLRSLRTQYGRMINYSVRHFQNAIISAILRGPGPVGLPSKLVSLYPAKLDGFKPRPSLRWWWFDRQALARMRRAAAAYQAPAQPARAKIA